MAVQKLPPDESQLLNRLKKRSWATDITQNNYGHYEVGWQRTRTGARQITHSYSRKGALEDAVKRAEAETG